MTLPIAPLTKAAFAPFGQVIETRDAKAKLINDGFAQRFDGLAQIDVAAEGGAVNISLFDGSLRPRPILIKLMERHPLGSQLFIGHEMPVSHGAHQQVADQSTQQQRRKNVQRGVVGLVWRHASLELEFADVIDHHGPQYAGH